MSRPRFLARLERRRAACWWIARALAGVGAFIGLAALAGLAARAINP